ncbi:unnamed protein product, partial [Gulo gulo]
GSWGLFPAFLSLCLTEFSYLWTPVSQSPLWQPDCRVLHHCQPRGSKRTSADVPRAPGSLRTSCSGHTRASEPGGLVWRAWPAIQGNPAILGDAQRSLLLPQGPTYPCELPAAEFKFEMPVRCPESNLIYGTGEQRRGWRW